MLTNFKMFVIIEKLFVNLETIFRFKKIIN